MAKKHRNVGVRMTAKHAAYFGIINELATKNPKATFEQIIKKVFPKGMPTHSDPEALKRKYRRAYELAR